MSSVPESVGATATRWKLAFWDPFWILGGALFLLAVLQFRRSEQGVTFSPTSIDRPGTTSVTSLLARFDDLGLGVSGAGQAVDLDPVGVGRDDRILGDAETGVELPLADEVVPGHGENLHHQ